MHNPSPMGDLSMSNIALQSESTIPSSISLLSASVLLSLLSLLAVEVMGIVVMATHTNDIYHDL